MKRNGFTLIEMLVGIVVSMLVIVAMATLYKNQVRITYGNNGLKTVSAQILAANNAVNIMTNKIQNAGFDISQTLLVNQHLKLYSNATYVNGVITGTAKTINTTAASGNLILWVENLSTTTTANYVCRGLYSNQLTTQIVYLYQNNCNSLPMSGWSEVAITKDYSFPSAVQFTLQQAGTTSCSPLKLFPTSGLNNSGVTFSTTVQDRYGSNTFNMCLANF